MSSDDGKLYVGSLSFDTTEKSLEEVFSKYGSVIEVVVIKDRETRVSRGFGFVTYENPDDAKDAMEAVNGMLLDGRQIRVDLAGSKGGSRGGSGARGGGSYRSRGGRGYGGGRSDGDGYQERNYYRGRGAGGAGGYGGRSDGGGAVLIDAQ